MSIDNMKIHIRGKRGLSGSVYISGAKNAALPELAATILGSSGVDLYGAPLVEDVRVMIEALRNLGACTSVDSNRIGIKIPDIKSALVPREIVQTSRASILMLGPLLARHGYAKISRPGGCAIGERKIDFHLEGLCLMGAQIAEDKDYITGRVDTRLKAIRYRFPGKSVTGTENLLMAAVLADGTTVLENCALEPEVGDLADLLTQMGADIQGKDTETLVIKGKTSLSGAEHWVIPDRIEMGTYVIAGGFAGNEIVVENARPEFIGHLLDILRGMGVKIENLGDRLKVSSDGRLYPVDVQTEPFPGFATDLQAQLTTLLTQAEGISRITETIFDNRFRHTVELKKMGADITIDKNTAVIRGKTSLFGREIAATDLRASAALVLGGLIAEGETVVDNAYQLLRGYENMPQKLEQLGAEVRLVGDGHG